MDETVKNRQISDVKTGSKKNTVIITLAMFAAGIF